MHKSHDSHPCDTHPSSGNDKARSHLSFFSRISCLAQTTWAPEYLAILVSAGALGSIIALLKKVDQTALEKWEGLLPLNTVISILSTVSKVTLAYAVGSCLGQGKWTWLKKVRRNVLGEFIAWDAASRGPLGCVELLYSLKSWHFGSVGAWLTIILLVFDPFMQAIVRFEGQREMIDTGRSAAVASRVTRLDVGSWEVTSALNKQDPVGPTSSLVGVPVALPTAIVGISDRALKPRAKEPVISSSDLFPDAGLRTTILMGFLNTSVSILSQRPLTSCASGNCTWPKGFHSVDLCHACSDVSSHIQKIQSKLDRSGDRVLCRTRPHSVPGGPMSGMVADNHTMPYGRDRHGRPQAAWLAAGGNYIGNKSECILSSVKSNFDPVNSYSFSDWDTLLSSFLILRVKDGFYSGTPFRNAEVEATECAIRFCAHSYKASFDNGVYEEQEQEPHGPMTRVLSSYQLSREEDQQNREKFDKMLNKSLVYPGGAGSLSDAGNWLFTPRHDLQLGLTSSVASGATIGGVPINELPSHTANISQKSIETMTDIFRSEDLLYSIEEPLGLSANLSESFRIVTRLMSNYLRENNNDPVSGISERWVIHIRVAWEFIFIPLATFVVAVLFIFGTIMDSKWKKLEVMKSDLFPVLMHGRSRHELGEVLKENGADYGLKMAVINLRQRQRDQQHVGDPESEGGAGHTDFRWQDSTEGTGLSHNQAAGQRERQYRQLPAFQLSEGVFDDVEREARTLLDQTGGSVSAASSTTGRELMQI